MAKFLGKLDISITEWFPPADTEANSLLNPAFTKTGPSPAAIAMAMADKENLAHDLRTLGVWNGKEDEGGMAYTTTYNTGPIPSFLSFNAKRSQTSSRLPQSDQSSSIHYRQMETYAYSGNAG